MSAPHLLWRNILQYQNRRIHCIREGRMMLTFLTGFHQQNIATLFAMEVANKSGKCCDFWRQYQLQGHFFSLRTETKFWSHGFTYVFAVLGKNVYSQNTKIFISGVQTAQELLRQIHRITLKKNQLHFKHYHLYCPQTPIRCLFGTSSLYCLERNFWCTLTQAALVPSAPEQHHPLQFTSPEWWSWVYTGTKQIPDQLSHQQD